MIYARRSETFRFASRNERFVLPVLVESGRARSVLAEKLRKRAAKALESLARINLCAGPRLWGPGEC
jgi:hypothetical protein